MTEPIGTLEAEVRTRMTEYLSDYFTDEFSLFLITFARHQLCSYSREECQDYGKFG